MNTKIISSLVASVFVLSLSFSVHAEEMSLEEAQSEITRLETENASLKQELEIYEKKIAEHKAKLEELDKQAMEMKSEMEVEE